MEKWFFPRQGSYFVLPACRPLQVFFPVVVAASCVYDFHCEIEAILKCFNNCLKEGMNVQYLFKIICIQQVLSHLLCGVSKIQTLLSNDVTYPWSFSADHCTLPISISLKGSILGTAWRRRTRPTSSLQYVCVHMWL